MTPDKFTITEKFIKTDDNHNLYTQFWGNPNSKTCFLFLHGGPGSGCNDKHKEFFDPIKQKVIFFDQRGAGNSTPKGSLKNNDTQHLIKDINQILDTYNINVATLVGGSWGSTLALAYALDNPSKVQSLILRGIFTGSQSEIDFLDKGGAKDFFPEAWEKFVKSVPKKYQNNPSRYHTKYALGEDLTLAKKSAYAYSTLEYSLIGLDDRRRLEDYAIFDPSGSIIEIYYLSNGCFMPDNFILDNAHNIAAPVIIVQGRYDAICPPINAYKLHQNLPNSQLIWTVAGHSGSDRANTDAIKTAIATIWYAINTRVSYYWNGKAVLNTNEK